MRRMSWRLDMNYITIILILNAGSLSVIQFETLLAIDTKLLASVVINRFIVCIINKWLKFKTILSVIPIFVSWKFLNLFRLLFFTYPGIPPFFVHYFVNKKIQNKPIGLWYTTVTTSSVISRSLTRSNTVLVFRDTY